MMSPPHPFIHISTKSFVNVPFLRLERDIQRIIDNRIQPEIGLDGNVLFTVSKDRFQKVSEKLKAEDLACTIHAPFSGLSPGDPQQTALKTTREKLHRAFELIPIFKPVSIVCHLYYISGIHDIAYDTWLKNSLDTWQELLSIASEQPTRIMFENTYESTPDMHKHILTTLGSNQVGFCLDVGHVMVYGRNSWKDWLYPLHPWFGQLHLHDNNGLYDDHLAVGEGGFDFHALFTYLKNKNLTPIITLEPHVENDLWKSLSALNKMPTFSKILY